MKYLVKYSVQFEVDIELDNEHAGNIFHEIDIPENNGSRYEDDSFEPIRLKGKYTANFKAVIDVAEGEDPEDAASNIDIPQNYASRYVNDSFEVLGWEQV